MHYHYLTIEQRESLQRDLGARIEALRGEIGRALRQSGDATAMRLANHIDEIDDQAVADLETVLEVAALERDVCELRSLEQTLQRLHTPHFGVCTDCERDIPFARLHAQLAATRCVRCQERFEREHSPSPPRSI